MREIRPSGLEGGVALTRHSYPYQLLTFGRVAQVRWAASERGCPQPQQPRLCEKA
jgi:hypothetical protein